MSTFSSLLEVIHKGAKGVCQIGYSTTSVLMCIGCGYMSFGRGLYICLPLKPSVPNLLDEPLKGFIMYLAYSLESVRGLTGPKQMGITTHSESVHLYIEFNKLVY
jgi:hypothetical protein